MHYTITDEHVSNLYLQKLIDAQKRGVKVFLVIDDLMSYPNKKLIRELKRNKAVVVKNNRIR